MENRIKGMIIIKNYSVGDIEKITGISITELRRLDDIKLFVANERTKGGHKRYSQSQLDFLLENKKNLNKLFYEKYCELPETAVYIKDSDNHWIDINGDVYAIDSRKKKYDRIFKKTPNDRLDYTYCGIRYIVEGKVVIKSKRVHRLVAEAYIPNPDNLPIVGHKNNIKKDNRVNNLYWTTISENTQKAVDDGLMVNDKGFDDSQSKPVNMYCTKTNEKLGSFGSISEAVRETGLSKTTISRQAKYKRPVRKPFYFRYADDVDCQSGNSYIVGKYSNETGLLLATYVSLAEASDKNNVSLKTVSRQVNGNVKESKYKDFYFNKIDITTSQK